jgi:hypothetical protein
LLSWDGISCVRGASPTCWAYEDVNGDGLIEGKNVLRIINNGFDGP